MQNNADKNEVQRLNKRHSISPINLYTDYYNNKLPPYYRGHSQQYECGPLDLTRRDSIETRQTTSPTNTAGSDDLLPPTSKPISMSTERKTNSQQRIIQVPPPLLPSVPYNNYLKQEPISPTLENYQYFPSSSKQTSPTTQQIQSSPCQSSERIGNFDPYEINKFHAIHFAHLAMNHHMATSMATTMSSISPRSSNSSDSSTTTVNPIINGLPIPVPIGSESKSIRPFKLYPKNPLQFIDDSLISKKSDEDYKIYRQKMVEQIYKENGGFATKTNPKMRRISSKNSSNLNDEDDEQNNNNLLNDNNSEKISSSDGFNNKDEAYYERRKKNNAAAKKSRDRRRTKEDELAIRAGFLERESIDLRRQLTAANETIEQLKSELSKVLLSIHQSNQN